MPEERFQAQFESWREQVEKEFPHYEPAKQWLILVTEKDGVPLYDSFQPELRITHRFSRKSEGGRRELAMTCPQDALALHLFTKPGSVHGYGELAAECRKWLPRWSQHFAAEWVKKLQLHYMNVLSPETVRPFILENRSLQLQRILTTFATVPGPSEGLIPPYDCTVTVQLQENPSMTLAYKVVGNLAAKSQPNVQVEFIVDVVCEDRGVELETAAHLLDVAHARIIERFELVFTEEAKEYFSQ